MLQQHENANGKEMRLDHPVERTLCARRTDGSAAPSSSNTRETIGNSLNPHNVGNGIEAWTADGTEQCLITTDGKRSTITLIPIPLDYASPDVAHIDWLAFTFSPPESEHNSIAQLLAQLAQLLGLPCIPAICKGKGWNGYSTRHDLRNGQEVALGLIASGGERQRGTIHIELNAHACALVNNWQAFAELGESLQARITRLDLAHDDLEGSTFTMQKMADWYKQGKFNCGGRQPSHTLAGDWLIDGSPAGRTIYIGKRENGKMLRIYEKGKQLGDVSSSWVRLELELRGKNRIIPWDALIQPGNYLAGSFNCLNFLSAEQDKIRTITKAATISYDRSVGHARLMVGKLVNVMMQTNHGDAFEVVNKLKRDGVPEWLKGYVGIVPLDGNDDSAMVD